jgi:hypothetical protein
MSGFGPNPASRVALAVNQHVGAKRRSASVVEHGRVAEQHAAHRVPAERPVATRRSHNDRPTVSLRGSEIDSSGRRARYAPQSPQLRGLRCSTDFD